MCSVLMDGFKRHSDLYVGDLSSICREEDLLRVFSEFGEVIEVRIQRDRVSNLSLCYGFIHMVNREEALAAVAGLDGVLFLGRRLKVRSAEFGTNHPVELPIYPICFKFSGLEPKRSTDEVHLRTVFGKFGEIDDVSIRKTFFDRVRKQRCIVLILFFRERYYLVDTDFFVL